MEQLLAESVAAPAFKNDVRAFCAGRGAGRIEIRGYIPEVKVKRLLMHVLATESALPIEQVELRGYSGCSDFGGVVELRTPNGPVAYEFVWCCRWRAEQEGWTDCFGLPDQMRAAREFDWRCFKVWSPKS